MEIKIEEHPLLDLGVVVADFPEPLGRMPNAEWPKDGFLLDFAAPLQRSEDVRAAVRDLLRHGGYKPTGRGKPASEYLVRAAEQGKLGRINPAVDALNVVSLHSGLPISIIDLDRAPPPLRVGLAEAEARYVFNTSGQEIRVGGLLCLHDAAGPCANAVKDSQRTKTHDGTQRTLSLIWGTTALPGRTAAATTWYADLLRRLGATVTVGA